MSTTAVEYDAAPFTFNEITNSRNIHKLDPILNTLKADDFRSILFLMIGEKLKREDFLILVRKEENGLKKCFLNIYYKFCFKDALLIEIFGTMQKFNLLKLLGTCVHTYKKDQETFTQLGSLWKFLYALCEQLEEGDVEYLKEKLFPERVNLNVCCAEELICFAFCLGKLEESSWKNKLVDIFKSHHPNLARLVVSYQGSNLNYYPLRRPTKNAPCGIAVIMNHVKFDVPNYKNRPESNSDASALKKLWEEFGFKTRIYNDLNAREVLDIFVKLSKEDHSNYDAFILCYLSHGDEDVVIARDGKALKFTGLVDIIANQCETLVGKPKLFFVQACQGRGIQTGFGGLTVIPTSPTETQIQLVRNKKIPLRADTLIFNATIEGFVCYRDGKSSWFISALVSNFEKYGEEPLVSSIFAKVKKEVSDKEGQLQNCNIASCKQTPVSCNTLQYELKLKKVL